MKDINNLKKICALVMCVIFSISLISCGKEDVKKPADPSKESSQNSQGANQNSKPPITHSIPKDSKPSKNDGSTLDLTKMSSTAIFSEVYNMMVSPEDYNGRRVKIKGNLAIGKEEKTKRIFFYCVIQDATQCCQQGLEFIWKGKHSYPKDYPKEGSEITVEGTFELYKEKGKEYCRLKDATMKPVK